MLDAWNKDETNSHKSLPLSGCLRSASRICIDKAPARHSHTGAFPCRWHHSTGSDTWACKEGKSREFGKVDLHQLFVKNRHRDVNVFWANFTASWVHCRCANISLHNARAVQPPDSARPTDWTTFQGNNAWISSAFPTRRWWTVDWVAFQTRTESTARDDRPRFKLVYHFYVQKTVLTTLLRLISSRLEQKRSIAQRLRSLQTPDLPLEVLEVGRPRLQLSGRLSHAQQHSDWHNLWEERARLTFNFPPRFHRAERHSRPGGWGWQLSCWRWFTSRRNATGIQTTRHGASWKKFFSQLDDVARKRPQPTLNGRAESAERLRRWR